MRMISFNGLSTIVRNKTVLEDINWTIDKGENWAIIGPNGAGKTSLLKIILGQLYYRGEFYIASGLRDRIEYVSFDKQATLMRREFRKWFARDYSGNFDYGVLRVRDMFAGQTGNDQLAGLPLVDKFEMSHLLDRDIQYLSTGEMRKMLILQALMAKPELLILDEPFSGLDSNARKRMIDIIEDLAVSDLQVLLVTHRFEEIPAGFNHLLCMKNGRIFKQGDREKVLDSAFIDALYGLNIPIDPPSENSLPPFTGSVEKTNDTLVLMEDVTVTYGKIVALHNLNWRIRGGENWLVRGPNGSGKTTLLSMITADNPQAYANRIFLFGKRRGTGESIWDIKQTIGIISAEFQIRYTLSTIPVTAFQVVLSGFFSSVGLFRHASREQRRTAGEWLERLSLIDYSERIFERLSYGEQRMILFARAMVKSPRLLILDEPFQGVDYANRKILMRMVDEVGMNTDTAVIYVTHTREQPECMTHLLEYDRETSQFKAFPITAAPR